VLYELEERQYAFTVYVYADATGVQEVVAGYKVGDSYGEKIAQRVLDSVIPLEGKLIKAQDDEDDE